MKGYLDRIEDNNLAVILIEEINEEIIIPLDELPEGSTENTWLQLEKTDDSFQVIAIDDEKTEQETETSQDLMAKLRAKSKGSKFKKK